MGSFLYHGVLVLSLLILLKGATSSLDKEFYVSWASDHVKFLNGGHKLQLALDQNSGSGFASKNKYLFGNINMQIKLVPGDSAGTVTAYYLSSEGAKHDELDFEFLGNKTGEPYVVQTNVYASGKGEREQRIYLWFDPTKHFHSYGVVWTAQHILFMVDNVPIRVFRNHKAAGVAYPDKQAMGVYSSLWNGDSWATQGGLVKIDWSHAPFVASYRNFSVQSMAASMGEEVRGVSSEQWKKLQWVKKNFMIYNYCNDRQRYPLPPALPCLLTYFLLFFSPTSFFFSSSLDLDSFFTLMAAQTHGFGFLHHALLLLFMLMVFWPFSDFNTWFTAAQEQQAMHEGKIRANQSETIENRNDVKMIPVPEIKYMPWAWENDKNRRKLAPFQLCSGCTCCGSESNKSICTTSACCYSITCGLPDKPYGVCAFTPKACDCTNCGV